MERIGLKEAISSLRAELSESILAAADEKLQFEVGDINLEFKAEIERAVEGSAGIKIYVVDIGGKGAQTSSTAHTIQIALKPVTQAGGPVLTGGGAVPE